MISAEQRIRAVAKYTSPLIPETNYTMIVKIMPQAVENTQHIPPLQFLNISPGSNHNTNIRCSQW